MSNLARSGFGFEEKIEEPITSLMAREKVDR